MVSGCQMLAVAGLSQAMEVEPFSVWIPDTTTKAKFGPIPILLEIFFILIFKETLTSPWPLTVKHLA